MKEVSKINLPLPKLYQAIVLDLVGLLSYVLPVVGEYFDIAWAPLSAWFFFRMYGGRLGVFGAAVSFVEEILPFTDFIPTFTIGWVVKRFLIVPNPAIQGAP